MRRNNQASVRVKADPKVLIKSAQQQIDYIIKLAEDIRFHELDNSVVEFYKFIGNRDFPIQTANLFREFVSTTHQSAYVKECQKNYIDAVGAAKIGDDDEKIASIALLRDHSRRATIAGSKLNLQKSIDKLTTIADLTTQPMSGKVAAPPSSFCRLAYPNNKRRVTRIVSPNLIVKIGSVLSVAQDWSMHGMRISPITGNWRPGDKVEFTIICDSEIEAATILCSKKGRCATVVAYDKGELRINLDCQCLQVIRVAIHLIKESKLIRT